MGRRSAGPFTIGSRMDYWALAAAWMAWTTDSGVPVPAYRVATASLIAPPSSGVVAWSRYSWTNFALARPSSTSDSIGSVVDASEPLVVGRMPELVAPHWLAA